MRIKKLQELLRDTTLSGCGRRRRRRRRPKKRDTLSGLWGPCLLKTRADRHDTQRAAQELVKFHLTAALLVHAHHKKVEFFAGKINGDLGGERD